MKDKEILYREFTLDRKAMNSDERIVPASLSSEEIFQRWFGRELLVHDKESINLKRASDGLPLLFNHNTDQPIGLAKNVHLEDGKLKADLHFSKNTRAQDVWSDVESGFLRNMSIGYRVHKYEENDKDDIVRITDWEVLEASVVPVPADATVGINRAENLEGEKMTTETETRTGEDTGGGPGDVIKLSEIARKKEREQGIKLEAARRDGIDDLFDDFMGYDGAEEIKMDCVRNNKSVDESRVELLRFLGGRSTPTAKPMSEHTRRASATPNGDDSADKWAKGIQEALEVKFGIEQDREKIDAARRSNEFMSLTLMDIARDYMRRSGRNINGLSSSQIAGQSLQRHGVISHTSSDFTDVLANVATKSLMVGYTQNAETWRPIVRIGSLSDYKQAARVGLTSFPDLDRLVEAEEYKHGTTNDIRENITMRKYGKLFSITREAIINSDEDTFSRIPRLMGTAAARVVGDLVYNEILLGNPTLNQDATALFAAGHGNYVAPGSGAAPSVTTLDAAMLAMRTQTDPDGNSTLNVMPQYLIVPAALEATALALTTAINYDTAPGATSGRQPVGSVNRYASLTPIVEPRIDANDSAKWFLSASPTMYDTIEVAFLNGNENPYMEQQDGFSQDGVTYKIRLEATAAAMGYVGLYFNDGN